jgi:uncharacterized protein (TIGR03437 family)
MTHRKSLIFQGFSFLLISTFSASAQTATFDFDTGTPALQGGQQCPEQTAGGITARFTSDTPFVVQNPGTTWRMSRFSGKYLSQIDLQQHTLTISFSQRLSNISLTFATNDLEIEVPTSIILTAFLDSTSAAPVGSVRTRGAYTGTETYPSGVVTYDSGGRPFNIVQFRIDPQAKGASVYFLDNIRVTPLAATPGTISSHVSAASYAIGGALAPASIASIFGSGLAAGSAAATTLVPPTTLADTSVTVKDILGAQRPAPLFYVGPTQINYVVPEGSAPGAVDITVASGSRVIATTSAVIEAVAPGLFTANADGAGAAAAWAITVAPDSTQTTQAVARCGSAAGSCVTSPVDLGPAGTQVVLTLYGTGIRGRSAPGAVTAKIGGVDAPVLYAGSQTQYSGLDQVNVTLPRSLAGRGDVDVVLSVDGKTANTVKVNVR